jgi:hypothetical protein
VKFVIELRQEAFENMGFHVPPDLTSMATSIWLEKDDGTIVVLKGSEPVKRKVVK